MKKNYVFDTSLHKINITAETLWMESQLGEGELEVVNHGRSRISTKSFSQETGAIGQQVPRIGTLRPKLNGEFSAGRTRHSDSTPHFLFSHHETMRESIDSLKRLLCKRKADREG